MTNRYALADYILTISFPANETIGSSNLGNYLGFADSSVSTISIGGPGSTGYEGSFLDSITIKRNNDLWDTKGDATGSWIHTKNLNRTGLVSLDIYQVADEAVTLSILCNAYEMIQQNLSGLEIVITNSSSNTKIAICDDCYIKKLPDIKFGENASTFSFEFTCGCIRMYPDGRQSE